MAVDRPAPLTHSSFPDPVRPLKEIAEDTLPRGLLEARSEVSGCLFFFFNILFFMRRVVQLSVLPSLTVLAIDFIPVAR